MRKLFSPVIALIRRFPLGSFLTVLALLVGLIFISNQIGKPTEETATEEPIVKQVSTYRVSGNVAEPVYVTVQAKVESNGSLRVLAQQAGVVQKVHIDEGEKVQKGGSVVTLSSTYNGSSAPALQRQLAQTQYNTAVETYDIQKSLIATQRQVAETQSDNAAQLREIAQTSVTDVEGLTSYNVDIKNRLLASLEVLEQDPQSNAALITQTRSQIAQIESGLLQLRAQYRQNELQAQASAPPAELSRLGKEATLQQLQLQERTLETTKQAALLQLKLAQLQEASLSPTAPKAAVVERVYVREGQTVTPGMPLYQLRYEGNPAPVKLVAAMSGELAKRVLKTEKVAIAQKAVAVDVDSYYVSQDATDGVLYSLTAYADGQQLMNGSFVTINVPVQPNIEGTILLPVDITYQSQNGAYVYVLGTDETGNSIASVRQIELGQVVGSFVEVLSGLEGDVQVITDRTVLEGDRVEIKPEV